MGYSCYTIDSLLLLFAQIPNLPMPFWFKMNSKLPFLNVPWQFVIWGVSATFVSGEVIDESKLVAPDAPTQFIAMLNQDLQIPLLLVSLLAIGLIILLFGTKSKVNKTLGDLQRQLNRKNAELEILEKRKHYLISTVSHDLRNPLTGIIGIIDTLRIKETIEDHKVREELIDLASASAQQAISIVENLINLELIYSGELQLNLEPRAVQPILKVVAIENRLMLQAKGQRLVSNFELATQNVSIMCEESALIQVISNLISNASKFSPADCNVELTMKVAGDEVMIGIRDKGPGVSRDQFESLFDPFSNTKGVKKSMGFGLSTVKSLTQAMGGEVGLESREGKGSLFWVRFPLRKENEVSEKVVLVKPSTSEISEIL